MFDFKTLIDSMVGKKDKTSPTSPLVESATKLVQKLPQEEYFGAHIEVIKAITRLNNDKSIPLAERLQTLLYIDERTFPIHQRICEDHFNPENSKRNFIPAILAYINELAVGYSLCLSDFLGQNAPKELLPSITLAAVRGLVHHNQQILWYAQRYTEPQGSTWKQAYQFFEFLERVKLERYPVKAYQSIVGTETIPEQVLLHSAFLKIANTSSLNTQEIRQLHYILGKACKNLHIQTDQQNLTEPVFMLDLRSEEAPHFFRRSVFAQSSRYWSGGAFVAAVQDVIQSINIQDGSLGEEALPEYLVDDPMKTDPASWQAFFEKIQKCLLEPEYQPPPADLVLAAEEVFVTVGFNLIAFKAKQELTIPSARERQESRWVMTSVSTDEIGLTHFSKENNSLLIGDLILVEFMDSLPILGVVRRLIKNDDGSTKVGLETIGSSPMAITLIDLSNPNNTFFGLYVTHDKSKKASRALLVPNALVQVDKEVELSTSGQSYMIRLKTIESRYNECSNCGFETVGKA
ncbi:hypothetical protein [Neisseria sp. Ec49-e6-T10]|uniref:hypothetical protein n=1 Tax=Neisseria sp. Ec49-e6-T10 TaxID=3140744 RepID=UPI003EB75F89